MPPSFAGTLTFNSSVNPCSRSLFAQFSSQDSSVPEIEIADQSEKIAPVQDAKTAIELAKLRTQVKKLEKQLSVRDDAKKRALLQELNQQLHALQGA